MWSAGAALGADLGRRWPEIRQGSSVVLRHETALEGSVFTARERITTTVCPNDADAARRAAAIVARTLRRHNEQGGPTVLGLATGNTPIGVYQELIRMHRDEGLDFSRVVTFNLDEYYPMAPDSIQSYRRWMQENFFDQVNVAPENVHVPDGTVPPDEVADHCRDYERRIEAAGGIDVQILGIGRTGHIGFNEPGSAHDSLTRRINLDPVTRRDAAADFFGEDNVPHQAITMGVGTILRARRVLLLAFGEQKASIIRKAVEEPLTDSVAASFLQQHAAAELFVDAPAAAELTRVDTPWLLGEIEWTPERRHRAVIWLSLEVGKSILKLDQDDYDTHHMAALVRQAGSADELNRIVYDRLSDTIVHYGSLPTDRRVLCFSPHPDDDVISMGGALTRLAARGNEVHVAYMTSGNIAVFDDHTLQMLEFWSELNGTFAFEPQASTALLDRVRAYLAGKPAGAVDSSEIQAIKGRIRRAEATAACRSMDIPAEHAHFLDLPFYQTGEVRKRPVGLADVEIVLGLLREVRPQWLFVAGELSDPHGTHRLCAEAIFAALKRCAPNERPEITWLYRGAWQEWEPHVIDMAIPISKSELTRKIFGIFKHQSQKDKALFPGPYDDREFWQRAEARNTDTAETYNRLGLPEHYAMEAFVRYEGA